jgi:aromatase
MMMHTLIYRFADTVSVQDREQFFTELREVALQSGLVEEFGHTAHHWLPVDREAKGITATDIAQFACADAESLEKFSQLPHVHEFIARWRSAISYEAAYANHEDVLPRLRKAVPAMRHTEHTVTVQAPVSIVWDVLVDVEGYARIFPPTQEVTILEESPRHQIARLVVDVNGTTQSWVSRRDIDSARRVIGYRQLEKAPMMGHMGGEWRALPIDDTTTQLVLTHDFKPSDPVDGKVAGRFTYDEAEQHLQAAVERNSVADLGAVRDHSEQRHGLRGRAA